MAIPSWSAPVLSFRDTTEAMDTYLTSANVKNTRSKMRLDLVRPSCRSLLATNELGQIESSERPQLPVLLPIEWRGTTCHCIQIAWQLRRRQQVPQYFQFTSVPKRNRNNWEHVYGPSAESPRQSFPLSPTAVREPLDAIEKSANEPLSSSPN
jgi:hypothetical protein